MSDFSVCEGQPSVPRPSSWYESTPAVTSGIYRTPPPWQPLDPISFPRVCLYVSTHLWGGGTRAHICTPLDLFLSHFWPLQSSLPRWLSGSEAFVVCACIVYVSEASLALAKGLVVG